MLGVRCVDVVLLESIFKLGWCFPIVKTGDRRKKSFMVPFLCLNLIIKSISIHESYVTHV